MWTGQQSPPPRGSRSRGRHPAAKGDADTELEVARGRAQRGRRMCQRAPALQKTYGRSSSGSERGRGNGKRILGRGNAHPGSETQTKSGVGGQQSRNNKRLFFSNYFQRNRSSDH